MARALPLPPAVAGAPPSALVAPELRPERAPAGRRRRRLLPREVVAQSGSGRRGRSRAVDGFSRLRRLGPGWAVLHPFGSARPTPTTVTGRRDLPISAPMPTAKSRTGTPGSPIGGSRALRRTAALVLIASLAVATMTATLASASAASGRPRSRAGTALVVKITGLPPAQIARVRVTGPNGYSRLLTRPGQALLSHLRPGQYRASVAQVALTHAVPGVARGAVAAPTTQPAAVTVRWSKRRSHRRLRPNHEPERPLATARTARRPRRSFGSNRNRYAQQ